MKALKVVDLFSGCGGMSAGFAACSSSFEMVGAVDLEVSKPSNSRSTSTRCNATYERNIGIKPLNADLMNLDPEGYRNSLGLSRGDLDVLIACPPCTGFSQMKSGSYRTDDPRNCLVVGVAAFTEAFYPEFLVMENVRELVTGKHSRYFEEFRGRLARLGYSIHAQVYQLADHGLPQRRKRLIVIARRGHSFVGSPLMCKTFRATVWQAIAHLPKVKPGKVHPSDPMHVAPGMGETVKNRVKLIPKNGGSWRDILSNPALSLKRKRQLLTPSMLRRKGSCFPDVYGRLSWGGLSPTITRECGHPGNGRYLHPEQDRLLTVREMALLQGFPPDYWFEGPLLAKYNQIGNAVPPLIASKIAEYILALLNKDMPNLYQVKGAPFLARQLSLAI
ncbi:MAG: DNA cytosine methyltransferase [Cyanobacteria bacterium P01_H01_bin.121]